MSLFREINIRIRNDVVENGSIFLGPSSWPCNWTNAVRSIQKVGCFLSRQGMKMSSLWNVVCDWEPYFAIQICANQQTCVEFKADRVYSVFHPLPVAARVYDYYEPGK